MVDDKIWLLLALVWLLWALMRARQNRVSRPSKKRWKLLRDVPGDS
jgi:hypothetical protein